MFRRENRLLPGTGFNNAISFSTLLFVLKTKKNGLALNKFGIVVSKKIDKRAVVRNRIKRIFRSILFDLMQQIISGHDILFITRPAITGKTREEISEQIIESLRKAGLIL